MKIITISSRPLDDFSDLTIRRQPQMMYESCQRFGVPLINLWRDGMKDDWTGATGEARDLEYLQTLPADEPVIVTDAWDAFFAGTPEEMEAALLAFDRPVIISTEPNLWPKETAHLMHHPPAPTRFRFACGGGWGGKAGTLCKMLTAPDRWPEPLCCNQAAFDDWYCRHPETTTLDFHCRLFQCLYDDGITQPPLGAIMEVKGGRIHNKETDSYPLVIHGGGGFAMEALGLWLQLKEQRGWM